MRTIKFVCGLVCLLAFSACSTSTINGAAKVQAFLNATLPSAFVGDADLSHANPYFDFTIEAKGLRRDERGVWQWDAMEYKRRDRFTSGVISLRPLK